MQNQEIIDRITNELIEEIKTSEKNFSNEEIKEKIDQKLIEYTLNSKESLLQKEKSKEADLMLKNEFTKIDDDNENEDFDFEIENDFDENNADNNFNVSTAKNAEDKKDKKFFQEVKDIYKNEFKQSFSCFSNVVDSMKLTSETSLFELILVFLFLIIPAILAGCIAFLIVILLFIIWQIYLITQTIYKLFEKAEFSIKDTIKNIKIKIKNYKKSGGFVNKLIFSNALYTLLMFNGVMYMLIKGLMLPVKSILDVEKILANIIAKIEKGITTALKAPSELAVANTKSQNLKASKKSKDKNVGKDNKLVSDKKLANNKKLKAEIKELNQKEKLKEKSQQKQEKIDEKAKALHQAKNVELANAITKSLKQNLDKSSEKTIFDKQNLNKTELFANKVNEEKIVTEVLKNKEIEKLAMNSEAKSMPDSNFLGNDKQEMRNAVLGNIANVLAQIGKDIAENSFNKDIISKNLNRSSNPDMEKMLADARNEQIENQIEAQTAILKQNEIYGKDKVKEINAIYKPGGNVSLGDALQQVGVDLFTQQGVDKALEYAYHQADNNIANSDIDDAREFEQFVKKNPDATIKQYYENKLKDAQDQASKEADTYEIRYGKNCLDLFERAMEEYGYDPSKPLTEEQKINVCKYAAKKSSDDPKEQVNAMKDAAECLETIEEKRRCEIELKQQGLNKSYVDKLASQSNLGRNSELTI